MQPQAEAVGVGGRRHLPDCLQCLLPVWVGEGEATALPGVVVEAGAIEMEEVGPGGAAGCGPVAVVLLQQIEGVADRVLAAVDFRQIGGGDPRAADRTQDGIPSPALFAVGVDVVSAQRLALEVGALEPVGMTHRKLRGPLPQFGTFIEVDECLQVVPPEVDARRVGGVDALPEGGQRPGGHCLFEEGDGGVFRVALGRQDGRGLHLQRLRQLQRRTGCNALGEQPPDRGRRDTDHDQLPHHGGEGSRAIGRGLRDGQRIHLFLEIHRAQTIGEERCRLRQAGPRRGARR